MILCYVPYNRAYLHVHKGEEKVKGCSAPTHIVNFQLAEW